MVTITVMTAHVMWSKFVLGQILKGLYTSLVSWRLFAPRSMLGHVACLNWNSQLRYDKLEEFGVQTLAA